MYDLTDYEDCDGSDIEDYARFIRREMPPVLRRELESLHDHELQSREALLPRLVDIISRLQSRLHDIYQQSILSSPLPEARSQSAALGFSQDPGASGSGLGTISSASVSLPTPTPPHASDLVINAEEFANSLVDFEFDVGDLDMDAEEFQRLLDGCGPPDVTINAG